MTERSVSIVACICLFFLSSLVYSKSGVVPSIKLTGIASQGGLLVGKITPKPESLDAYRLELEGRSVALSQGGDFVIGFGRDAVLTQTIRLFADEELVNTKVIQLRQREYDIQTVDGVPQKTVTPSEDKLARIRTETALVKKARSRQSDYLFFLDRFSAPMNSAITGVYGSQRIYNGTPKRPHFGVDYAGQVGTPVYAPADGVVTLTHDDMFYSGGTLIVDHGHGVFSTFIHLSEITVQNGQAIKQGDLIAKVGKGGRSTGPHLDWRINWFEVRVDPLLVLEKEKILDQ